MLCLLQCYDVREDGAALAEVILNMLRDIGIDVMNCVGQGYDGPGAVAGKINGASAHILRLNPLALYTQF